MKYSVITLTNAIDAVSHSIEENRLGCASKKTPKSENILWLRLVECILGSQVPNSQAIAAANWLTEKGLMNVEGEVYTPWRYRSKVESALRSIELPTGKTPRRSFCLRFHRTKSEQISKAYKIVYLQNTGLEKLLRNVRDPINKRREIASLIPGIGPKQASLFMRNTFVTHDLAIIDSHIIRFMSQSNMIKNDKSISNISFYEIAEKKFREYFSGLNRSLASIDFATWIVMRESLRA